MIKDFKHKGLAVFFRTGSTKGIIPAHKKKLGRILDRLDHAVQAKDMDVMGYRLHQLKGKELGSWSVTVNGNWRVTFYFAQGNAYAVDYRDYH